MGQVSFYIVSYICLNAAVHLFPDADMLEVGNGGMTLSEYRVHFSLWALMKVREREWTDDNS